MLDVWEFKKKDNSVVCPICWRPNCRLFQKLMAFKYSAQERAVFLARFHHNTCKRCKRRRCNGSTMVMRVLLPCKDAPPKKLSKKKKLPDWWLNWNATIEKAQRRLEEVMNENQNQPTSPDAPQEQPAGRDVVAPNHVVDGRAVGN